MPFIQLEKQDNIAIVTINRQEKMNALNDVVLNELEAVFIELEKDTDCRAIILTGAGEKAFVAGADIGQFPTFSPSDAKEMSLRGQRVFNTIENSSKPVIAAVNGYALGGGCELALSCHMRYASENAVFGQPEVNLGVIAGFGGTQRLPRLIGSGNALDLLLTGRMVPADEAKNMRIVNNVYPLEILLDEVLKIAKTIAKKGPVAVKYSLKAVYAGQGLTLDKALEVEAKVFEDVFDTTDRIEGATAFLEKRKANFTGK